MTRYKSSVEKPAFKKVIGESVLMPLWLSASIIWKCGIIGDMFEMIRRFA